MLDDIDLIKVRSKGPSDTINDLATRLEAQILRRQRWKVELIDSQSSSFTDSQLSTIRAMMSKFEQTLDLMQPRIIQACRDASEKSRLSHWEKIYLCHRKHHSTKWLFSSLEKSINTLRDVNNAMDAVGSANSAASPTGTRAVGLEKANSLGSGRPDNCIVDPPPDYNCHQRVPPILKDAKDALSEIQTSMDGGQLLTCEKQQREQGTSDLNSGSLYTVSPSTERLCFGRSDKNEHANANAMVSALEIPSRVLQSIPGTSPDFDGGFGLPASAQIGLGAAALGMTGIGGVTATASWKSMRATQGTLTLGELEETRKKEKHELELRRLRAEVDASQLANQIQELELKKLRVEVENLESRSRLLDFVNTSREQASQSLTSQLPSGSDASGSDSTGMPSILPVAASSGSAAQPPDFALSRLAFAGDFNTPPRQSLRCR